VENNFRYNRSKVQGSEVQGSVKSEQKTKFCLRLGLEGINSGCSRFIHAQYCGRIRCGDKPRVNSFSAVCKKVTLNGELPGPDLTLHCSIFEIHIWEPDMGRNMILLVAPGRAEPVNAYLIFKEYLPI
jgi:hypothetical protein